MHPLQRAWLLASTLCESIYDHRKLHSAAISCVDTGNSLIADHCRSVRKLTDRAKYIQGQAALVHPEGTRFFSFAILYV